ncbi:MAG: hypothetical protein J2P49_10655 [Methylocapsa sp.]|nr:hypothetical protein [Methylocapsa sp.]
MAGGAVRLGAAAQTVIALRLIRLAKGGAGARHEAKRMVDEKITAALHANSEAARSILAGRATQIPARTLALYRARVRRNLRRLSNKL